MLPRIKDPLDKLLAEYRALLNPAVSDVELFEKREQLVAELWDRELATVIDEIAAVSRSACSIENMQALFLAANGSRIFRNDNTALSVLHAPHAPCNTLYLKAAEIIFSDKPERAKALVLPEYHRICLVQWDNETKKLGLTFESKLFASPKIRSIRENYEKYEHLDQTIIVDQILLDLQQLSDFGFEQHWQFYQAIAAHKNLVAVLYARNAFLAGLYQDFLSLGKDEAKVDEVAKKYANTKFDLTVESNTRFPGKLLQKVSGFTTETIDTDFLCHWLTILSPAEYEAYFQEVQIAQLLPELYEDGNEAVKELFGKENATLNDAAKRAFFTMLAQRYQMYGGQAPVMKLAVASRDDLNMCVVLNVFKENKQLEQTFVIENNKSSFQEVMLFSFEQDYPGYRRKWPALELWVSGLAPAQRMLAIKQLYTLAPVASHHVKHRELFFSDKMQLLLLMCKAISKEEKLELTKDILLWCIQGQFFSEINDMLRKILPLKACIILIKSYRDDQGKSFLHLAVEKANVAAVEFFTTLFFDEKNKMDLLLAENNQCETALDIAVQNEDAKSFNLLFDALVPEKRQEIIDKPNKQGKTLRAVMLQQVSAERTNARLAAGLGLSPGLFYIAEKILKEPLAAPEWMRWDGILISSSLINPPTWPVLSLLRVCERYHGRLLTLKPSTMKDEKLIALNLLRKILFSDFRENETKMEEFTQNFRLRMDIFKQGADSFGWKFVKAVLHILASVISLGLYPLGAVAYSYYKRGSPYFWRSSDDVFIDGVTEGLEEDELEKQKMKLGS